MKVPIVEVFSELASTPFEKLFRNMLSVIDAVVMIAAFCVFKLKPLPPAGETGMLVWLKLLPVMVKDESVPLVLTILRLSEKLPVTLVLVILTVPSRFEPDSPKSIPLSPTAFPLFAMFTALRVKPVTFEPDMPSLPPPVMFIRVRDTLDVLINDTHAPVEL